MLWLLLIDFEVKNSGCRPYYPLPVAVSMENTTTGGRATILC